MPDITLLYGAIDAIKASNLTDAITHINTYVEQMDENDVQASEQIAKLRQDLELSVCYSPGAIRDSYDMYDDDDPRRIAVEQASDDELLDISYMIVGGDLCWQDFHENIDMCVVEKFNINS